MDREVTMLHLRQAFGGTPGERRAVARAATDLADAGMLAADRGSELTPEVLLEELADAPADADGPAERWNWWVSALSLAYGDQYSQFLVQRWTDA
jgi:hypothetical protein